MDVFLVPWQGKEYGRRVLIHEAGTKETIPGVNFTDKNYIQWSLCLKAVEDTELTVIEDGVTNVLRSKFAQRAGLTNYEMEGFEDALVEKYDLLKISEDVEIQKKERAEDQAIEERQRAVERIAGINEAEKAPDSVEATALQLPDRKRSLWLSLRLIMDAAFIGAGKRDLLLCFLWAVCIVATALTLPFLAPVFIFLKAKRIGDTASAVASSRQQEAYGRIFDLQESFFRRHSRAETAGLCMGIYDMTEGVVSTAYTILTSAAICLVLLVAAIIKAPAAGTIFAVCIIIVSVIIMMMRVHADDLEETVEQSRARSGARLYQYIRNISKVKISGSEENILRDYYLERSEKAQYGMRALRFVNAAEALQILLICGLIPLTICLAAKGTGSLFLVMLLLTAYALQLALQMAEVPQMAKDWTASEVLMKEEAEGTGETIGTIEEFRIEHVGFAYDDEMILKDLSLTIRKGDSIGLIGGSGSGKSTLMKLITGFERPTEGTIYINGIDTKTIDWKTARQRIGMIMQDGALLAGSLLDNIRMETEATPEEVLDAVRRADLGEFVESLPMGIETVLNEEAGTISGGQKQKILIARALIRRPDLIIMDESMSEMDNRSIEKICKSLEDIEAAKIIISHRIEPLQICDQIYEMEKINSSVT